MALDKGQLSLGMAEEFRSLPAKYQVTCLLILAGVEPNCSGEVPRSKK